jgi:dTDP-4-amino-4,6-dideoxygalactose transaminase
VGGIGDAACFSLHPLKNLHAFGDGGMVTTNRQEINGKMIMARNHGLKNREECEFWSFNSRLDEIQAAMLSVQLPLLDKWTEERRKIAFRYNELLRPYADVPDEGEGEYCVFQTFVVQVPRRDELMAYLNKNGVQALVHYPLPLHLQPAAKNLGYQENDFPVTMEMSKKIISLPLYPELSKQQQDHVVNLFKAFYK